MYMSFYWYIGDTSAALNGNGTIKVPGGFKVGPDGRGGEQPRGTVVKNNICHEIGMNYSRRHLLHNDPWT